MNSSSSIRPTLLQHAPLPASIKMSKGEPSVRPKLQDILASLASSPEGPKRTVPGALARQLRLRISSTLRRVATSNSPRSPKLADTFGKFFGKQSKTKKAELASKMTADELSTSTFNPADDDITSLSELLRPKAKVAHDDESELEVEFDLDEASARDPEVK